MAVFRDKEMIERLALLEKRQEEIVGVTSILIPFGSGSRTKPFHMGLSFSGRL